MVAILALVRHPEVQRAAHEELDRVVGKDSLPTFRDLEDLPYVKAICTEALRSGSIIETHKYNTY